MLHENNHRSFPEERRQEIRALISENGRVSVEELTLRFHVSRVTIRGDLDWLEHEGVVQRTHGGALFIARAASHADPPFLERAKEHANEKEQIGRAAADLIQAGDIIFLDAGTTSLAVAKHLRRRIDITVITIGLRVAMALEEAEGVTVVMPGGIMRPVSMSLVGDYAIHTLESMHINKAFVSGKGLTLAEGLTDVNAFEVATKKFAVQRADQVIGIIDHTKWGRVSFATFAQIDQVTTIITDHKAPPALVQQLQAQGVNIIFV